MVNESDTGRVIPGLPSLYQEFKLNCRFFMCVLGEGPIKPFVENVDKQKKEDDTIDLNIFNLDKPKSFRLPKRYVNLFFLSAFFIPSIIFLSGAVIFHALELMTAL